MLMVRMVWMDAKMILAHFVPNFHIGYKTQLIVVVLMQK